MRVIPGLASLPVSRRVLELLDQARRGGPPAHRAIGGLWGGSSGLLIRLLQHHWAGPLLVVTADDDETLQLEGDIECFPPEEGSGASDPVTLLAERHDVDGQVDPASRSQRMRTLIRVHDEGRFLLIAGLQALLQPVPSHRALRRGQVRLEVGAALDQRGLFATAVAAGLRPVPVVLAPGEISQRGDILDVYPLATPHAYRLEFFGEELESIRTFDPASQRSLSVVEAATVTLGGVDEKSEVIDHLRRPDLLVLHYEPLRIEEEQVRTMSPNDASDRAHVRFREAIAGLSSFDLAALPAHDLDYKILSAGSAVGSGEADPIGRLRSIRGLRGHVHILCPTAAACHRLAEIFTHRGVSLPDEKVTLAVGTLSRGFRVADLGLTLVSNTEFAGVPPRPRVVERPVLPSRALASFFELGPGDVVVHAVHGISRFEGIELVSRGEAAEDHLRLLFRDDVRLLVPASKVHLVQKYIGGGGGAIKLDKLGGKSFARRKAEVTEALFDMAADLLDLQAARATIERPPYPPDPLEAEFLDGFPFTDTADQARSWDEIRSDLEGPRPMDRLVCGDVGFGKTELALRAAFKVAITGRQVAILVPTTILAEQHGRSFAERFAPHALRIEVLSRFRAAKDRRAVLADLATGAVDVLVGTHRLLSDDVRFRDLGLIVVDEEQRFGVRHKEHIKQMRRAVDVLTLSATPIPRTLHASLVGIRDISTLGEAPPGRQEVDTRIVFQDPGVVQRAIEHELQREGQVYFLHNRVQTIERVAARIRDIVPAATVTIGHGQMTEAQLEKALRGFVRGEADVLVCTAIIENGLDIPRANTILIERPDLFGLAELHQLRGRVGRSARRAHCLLLLDRTVPISEDARKRLKAVEEFAGLGAGFAIAMKDLEIRGAGNLLGPEQSGHIAAVGYEMYCQLLKTAVQAAGTATTRAPVEETREVDLDLRLRAFIPDDYLADPKARLELFREMDGAQTPATALEVGQAIVDRCGTMPEPVQNLLLSFLLKHRLMEHRVLSVQWVDTDRLVVRHPPEQPLGGAWLDAFSAVRRVEAGKTHLLLPKRRRAAAHAPREVLALLLRALLGEDIVPMMLRAWSGNQEQRRQRTDPRRRSR